MRTRPHIAYRAPPHKSAVLRLALLVAVALCLAGCILHPQHRPPEYLDPVTAASVTSVSSPIVFARAHQDVAANSRQYTTLVGVSVNRSGKYEYVLLAYTWSTIDPRLGADVHPGDTLILLADDRAIRMVRDSRSLRDVGIAKPLLRPLHTRGSPRIYRTDRDTLKFVANARRLRLQLEGDGDARPFEVWEDGRQALGLLATAATSDSTTRTAAGKARR